MFAVDLVLLAVAWFHVLLTPYTKVEESFNLHATHDVLFHGVTPDALKHYDHFVFPGAVPRSFIGSVLLAWMVRLPVVILRPIDSINSKFHIQILLRLLLASLNTLGLVRIRRAVSERFGLATGVVFGLVSASQFHLPFWMGRTLPNMFAMIPFSEALARIVARRGGLKTPISLLVFAAVVFRAELAVYLAALSAFLIYERRISVAKFVTIGAISSLCSLALTILVDSYFWQIWPIWPEMQGIIFNVVQGKSADWGVSPFHFYFTNALPRLLMVALPMALQGMILDRRLRSLMTPPILFIIAMSFLAHKEWRFIVYVIPIFNISASYAMVNLWANGRPLGFVRAIYMAMALGMLAITCMLTAVSHSNYPGGVALRSANAINQSDVKLHICNLAAQTGASLFLHEHAPPYLSHSGAVANTTSLRWKYDKTEGTVDMEQFTHAIVEDLTVVDGWRINTVVDRFAGIGKQGLKYSPSLWVVSNRDSLVDI